MLTLPSLPGIDTVSGIRRAGGSVALYRQFLERFPSDTSLEELASSLGASDLEEAFRCAHTYKGLTAQLGIDALSAPASALCELLRPLDPAVLPSARQAFAPLCALHALIVRRIAAL